MSKVAINSNSNAPDIQDKITLALLQNGGVGRIQGTLQQRLDEAGWSENLRNYVTRLFRSGECTTFFEALEKVKSLVAVDGVEKAGKESKGKGGLNGKGASAAEGDAEGLLIPRDAAEGGVEAVRKELEGVCEMKK